jgi:hypothetical protein
LTFDRAQASQLSLYLHGLGWLFFAAEAELMMIAGIGPDGGMQCDGTLQ